MKLIKLIATATALSLLAIAPVNAAPIKAGSVCAKPNQQMKSAGQTLICKKSGKRFVWRVKAVKPATPPTTPVTPTPEVKRLAIYTGGAGGSQALSFDLPVSVAPAPANTNLKLWVYHPKFKNQPLRSPGIWLRKTGEEWKWFPNGNPDGSMYFNIAPGSYIFDTVEPDNNSKDFSRRTYSLTVSATGVASVVGLRPNAAGFYTVSVNDQTNRAPAFVPTSRCQILDRDVNRGMNVGFGKSVNRLTSQGVIKALILPIDFASLPSTGVPAEIFYNMATKMDTYFKEMSNNRVSFDFQVLPTWHRANFDPAIYKLGQWNGGDPHSYYKSALASADPVVDYSLFDVVYVLSPKTVPWSLIAYGPAFPTDISTEDGSVRNGTFSGADAYQQNDTVAWQWMAHETGHLFGIFDLYTIAPQASTYGGWDLMANNWGDYLELNSWNRYIQGWLADSQVRCLEPNQLTTPVEVSIDRLNFRNNEVKAAVVRLSDTKVLVAEVRRSGGYDKMPENLEGVLVYTVDTTIESIKGGYQVQRRPGSTNPDFIDAALKPGDKVKVGSVTVEVVSRGAQGDVVRFSN